MLGFDRFLLGKLDSDYKNKTDYFRHKFMSKVETIFSNLPRKNGAAFM
jgi:hypothetical protein